MTLLADTASAIVIGNELLTGKVQEANLRALSVLLRTLGIRLTRAVIIPDDRAVIAGEVAAQRAVNDVVFTIGGVGPTHDDVTVDGVAQAFGVDAVEDPTFVALLHRVYGERCTPQHLRMARVPRGATLLAIDDRQWPTARIGNVVMLPGVPELFRAKLDSLRDHLRGQRIFVTKAVYLRLEEAEVTPTLDAVSAAHPDVDIGSYPKWFDPSYKTKITFDGSNPEHVARAFGDFVERLTVDAVARIE